MSFVATDPFSHSGKTNTWLTPLKLIHQLGSANKYNTISNKDYNKILDYIYKVLAELGFEVDK